MSESEKSISDLPHFHCYRCNYDWLPRKSFPVKCPRCCCKYYMLPKWYSSKGRKTKYMSQDDRDYLNYKNEGKNSNSKIKKRTKPKLVNAPQTEVRGI